MRFADLLCLVVVVAGCGAKPVTFTVRDGGVDDAESDANAMLGDSAQLDTSMPKPVPMNLIPNGNFEQGNVLFATDYTYAMQSNATEGEYTVGTNAQLWNPHLVMAGDHTSGKTKMFIGNGKATPDRVWYTTSTIPVAPGTKYFFEAFVMNLCCEWSNPNVMGAANLSFYANDQLLGTRISLKLGVWEGLSTTWDSGNATSVTLKLVNANTEAIGNDFAVDDIYLGTVSIVNPQPN